MDLTFFCHILFFPRTISVMISYCDCENSFSEKFCQFNNNTRNEHNHKHPGTFNYSNQ